MRSAKNQYVATFFLSLVLISYGATCGWPSATFPILQSAETPLSVGPLSTEQISWVGSLLCPGGLMGTWAYGWLMEKVGRKMSICSTVIPQIVGWLLILYAKDETYLYVARLIGGFTGAGLFIVIPVYLAEIAETRIRGFLGSTVVLASNAGVFFAFLAGAYLDYHTVPTIFIPLSVLTLVGFAYLPESPAYLAKIGHYKEAEGSLKFYRGYRKSSNIEDEAFIEEISSLKKAQLEEDVGVETSSIGFEDFKSKAVSKSLLISFGLIILNQLCGLFAMLNYTVTIFKAAGSTLSPELSAVIVGFIQLLGSFAPIFLVENAGRRFLMILSATGVCCGQIVLGTYSYLDHLGYNVSTFNWIPLLSFAFAIFIGSWGVITLPFLILSEITLPKLRALTSTLCMSALWIAAFCTIKCLPFMMEELGMFGTMYLFATFCLFGTIFIVILMPETKGKSFDEITKMLEG